MECCLFIITGIPIAVFWVLHNQIHLGKKGKKMFCISFDLIYKRTNLLDQYGSTWAIVSIFHIETNLNQMLLKLFSMLTPVCYIL